jgi:hypothetical protein
VTITPTATGGERWVRRFGERTFASTIAPARDDPWTFEETAGVLTFRFSVARYPGGFSWPSRAGAWAPPPAPRLGAAHPGPDLRPRQSGRKRRLPLPRPGRPSWLGVIFGYAGRLTSPIVTSDAA